MFVKKKIMLSVKTPKDCSLFIDFLGDSEQQKKFLYYGQVMNFGITVLNVIGKIQLINIDIETILQSKVKDSNDYIGVFGVIKDVKDTDTGIMDNSNLFKFIPVLYNSRNEYINLKLLEYEIFGYTEQDFFGNVKEYDSPDYLEELDYFFEEKSSSDTEPVNTIIENIASPDNTDLNQITE